MAIVHFHWPSAAVPVAVEADVSKWLVSPYEWGLAELYPALQKKIDEEKRMTRPQLLSTRAWLLAFRAMCVSGALSRAKAEILYQHARDVAFRNLCAVWDFPPCAILRVLLGKYSSKTVMRALHDPGSMPHAEAPRNWGLLHHERSEWCSATAKADIRFAVGNDCVTWGDHAKQAADAAQYETELGRLFAAHGVECITEAEIKSATAFANGHLRSRGLPVVSVPTPDLVFRTPVCINGRPVHWVDAKRYYGSGVKLLARKLKKQADAFVRTWGDGALIFNLGFGDALDLGKRILKLDYSRVGEILVNAPTVCAKITL